MSVNTTDIECGSFLRSERGSESLSNFGIGCGLQVRPALPRSGAHTGACLATRIHISVGSTKSHKHSKLRLSSLKHKPARCSVRLSRTKSAHFTLPISCQIPRDIIVGNCFLSLLHSARSAGVARLSPQISTCGRRRFVSVPWERCWHCSAKKQTNFTATACSQVGLFDPAK